MAKTLSRQEALIYVMVTTAAVDGRIEDTELGRIGTMVRQLPIFEKYDAERLTPTAEACGLVLADKDGLAKVLDLVAGALPPGLHETAYALCVDVAAADLKVPDEEIRFLELLADRLGLSKLVTAAIERGARARHKVA